MDNLEKLAILGIYDITRQKTNKQINNAQHYTENKIYEQHEPYHKPRLNPCVSNEKMCTKYYFQHQYVIATLK